MNKRCYIILSVDWEPDHGKWRAPACPNDYGGILVGTPALEQTLDDLGIPCTWFIETSEDPNRNTPELFPEIVSRIARRSREEIGLHIHWRRKGREDQLAYETRDESWVRAQVSHGVEQLALHCARPESFRGGSFLYVEQLPEILAWMSFRNDSTLLWNRCYRLDGARGGLRHKSIWARAADGIGRYLGPLPQPYFAEHGDVERSGSSPILEFPVFYNILDVPRARHRWLHRSVLRRAAASPHPVFISLFFHIDELTLASSGPDASTALDRQAVRHFRENLQALQEQEDAVFVTVREARNLLERESVGQIR